MRGVARSYFGGAVYEGSVRVLRLVQGGTSAYQRLLELNPNRMRWAPEVESRLNDGASLSEADAQRLERGLEQQPNDVDARVLLVGYYEARGKEAFRAITMQGKISI